MKPVVPPVQDPGSRASAAAVWVALLLAVGLVLAVTLPAARLERTSLNPWHHYEYLTEGFFHGHTYLSVDPPPDLLKMADPYSPSALPTERLWDASLYQGKYYLYFGPAPALLLMLPWRSFSGYEMPQRVAVAAWAIVGLVGLTRLLWEIRGRYFPGLTSVKLGLILTVAVHASWFPVLLRRPAFWELAIVAAVACVWWSLFFLWRFHLSGGRARWAVALGLCLAAMMGSRVIELLPATLFIALLLVPTGAAQPARSWQSIGAAALLTGLGGIALLVYNFVRFGHWQEFGQNFQLSGADYRATRFLDPHFIFFNAWAYLFSLPELGPYFPFVHPVSPVALPVGHAGLEEMHGILFAMPIHLSAGASLAWAVSRRRAVLDRPLVLILAAAFGTALLLAGVFLCLEGVCSRYIAELCSGLTVVTAVGLMALFGAQTRRRGSLLIRVLAVAAALWTVAYTWLASADFKGYFQRSCPDFYAAAAHTLNYPSYWEANRLRLRFGPVDLQVEPGAAAHDSWNVIMASGRPGMANQLVLERVAAHRYRFRLTEDLHTTVLSPEVNFENGTLWVHVEAPWLYPPIDHPYWDALTDAGQKQWLHSRFALTTTAGTNAVAWTHFSDPVHLEPSYLEPAPEGTGRPGVAAFERTADPVQVAKGGP